MKELRDAAYNAEQEDNARRGFETNEISAFSKQKLPAGQIRKKQEKKDHVLKEIMNDKNLLAKHL